MSTDHIISAFVASCFALLTSTMLVCLKVQISTNCDVLLGLGNEMVEFSVFPTAKIMSQ